MKKIIAVVLIFALMLSACSNWSVEIKEPESGAQSESVAFEKVTEIQNYPESDFVNLSAEEQQVLLAALEALASDYRSGSRELLPDKGRKTDFAFPEPITPEDFSFEIRQYEGLETRYRAVFYDYGENGAETYPDKINCIFYFKDGEFRVYDFSFSARYVPPEAEDHTSVETGFGTSYINEKFGFRVDFSEIWDNSYTPVAYETKKGEGGEYSSFTGDASRTVDFYYKDCVPGCSDPYYSEIGALIFSVQMVSPAEYEALEEDDSSPHIWDYIGKTANWVYLLVPELSNECIGADAELCAKIMSEGEKTVSLIE